MVSLGLNAELWSGLYTPAEAGRLARVPARMVARWVRGPGPSPRARRGEDRRSVCFLDLVQMLAVRAIRRHRQVPLTRLRALVDHAEHKMGLSCALARPHETFLVGQEVVLRIGGRLVQLDDRFTEDDLGRPVPEPYQADVAYRQGLAVDYCPLREESRYILIDPRRRAGQPVVRPCGVSVHAILETFADTGTMHDTARELEIDMDDVLLALKYDDFLAGVGG